MFNATDLKECDYDDIQTYYSIKDCAYDSLCNTLAMTIDNYVAKPFSIKEFNKKFEKDAGNFNYVFEDWITENWENTLPQYLVDAINQQYDVASIINAEAYGGGGYEFIQDLKRCTMKRVVEIIKESILSSTNSGKASIEEKLKQYNLDPAKVKYNDDGTIDYKGPVFWWKRNLTEIPFRFNKVFGDFDCRDNQLTSLEGAPKIVRGAFKCDDNMLTSLEGGPKEVHGDYSCSYNKLTSLKGGPEYVGNIFYCTNNQITSLRYAPKHANGFFCYGNNKRFTWEKVRAVCDVPRNKIFCSDIMG